MIFGLIKCLFPFSIRASKERRIRASKPKSTKKTRTSGEASRPALRELRAYRKSMNMKKNPTAFNLSSRNNRSIRPSRLRRCRSSPASSGHSLISRSLLRCSVNEAKNNNATKSSRCRPRNKRRVTKRSTSRGQSLYRKFKSVRKRRILGTNANKPKTVRRRKRTSTYPTRTANLKNIRVRRYRKRRTGEEDRHLNKRFPARSMVYMNNKLINDNPVTYQNRNLRGDVSREEDPLNLPTLHRKFVNSIDGIPKRPHPIKRHPKSPHPVPYDDDADEGPMIYTVPRGEHAPSIGQQSSTCGLGTSSIQQELSAHDVGDRARARRQRSSSNRRKPGYRKRRTYHLRRRISRLRNGKDY